MLAVVLVAGCGGGSEKLSHSEFVTKADAICTDSNQRVAALGTPKTYDEIAAYAKEARSILQEDVGKFKKLSPPDADRDNWQAFAEKGDEIISDSRDLEAAAKRHDTPTITELLVSSKQRSIESKRIAKAMGTTECAKT